MLGWRFLTVVFVSFVVLAGSLVSDVGVKELLFSFSEGITGFVGYEGSPLARNVDFKAELSLEDYELLTELTNVSLRGEPFQISLDTKPKQTVKTSGQAHLFEFKGEIIFKSGTAALEGTVKGLENINYEKPIKMKSTGFVYQSVSLDTLTFSEFKRETVGSLSTQNLNYSINGTVEIHGFRGEAEFRPGLLLLDGKANRILSSGGQKFSLLS